VRASAAATEHEMHFESKVTSEYDATITNYKLQSNYDHCTVATQIPIRTHNCTVASNSQNQQTITYLLFQPARLITTSPKGLMKGDTSLG